MKSELRFLAIDDLTIGEDVRLDEDTDALAELALSIAQVGILQPLTVRQANGSWEVVAGRRRLAAARLADLSTVPCIVRSLDNEEAFDVALAENLHRRDLTWIEVAMAYDQMRSRGMTQREIASHVGRHESQVSQVLKLLTIPEGLQNRLQRREISYTTALDLARRGGMKNASGGGGGKGSMSRADAEIATHWRRRHDRLVAGIKAVIASHDDERWPLLLEQLLKIDLRPLDEAEAAA